MELVNESGRTGHGVLSHFAKLQRVGTMFTEACAVHGAEMTIKKIQQDRRAPDQITVYEGKSGMCGLLEVSPYKIKNGENFEFSFRPDPPDMSKSVFLSWLSNSKRGPMRGSLAFIAAQAVRSLQEEARLYEQRQISRSIIFAAGGVEGALYRYLPGFLLGLHGLNLLHDGSVKVEFIGELTAKQAIAAISAVG